MHPFAAVGSQGHSANCKVKWAFGPFTAQDTAWLEERQKLHPRLSCGMLSITLGVSAWSNDMAILKSDYEMRIDGWLRRSPARQQGVAFVPEMAVSVATAVGEVRRENQDRAVAVRFLPGRQAGRQEAFSLLILSDGIGGLLEGDRCAEQAIATTITTLIGQPDLTSPGESLRQAFDTANRDVFARHRGRGGATLVAVLFCRDGRVLSATAGDSRIYRCKFSKPLIEQISVDDTIAGELSRLRGTEIRQEELGSAASHLAQFVGIGDGFQPRIQPLSRSSKDEWLLLTSDGLHSIGTHLLGQLAAAARDTQTFATRCLQVSRWCGGYDNATIICSDFRSHIVPNDPSLDSACLEVWDAFGKCEFLFNTERPQLQSLADQPKADQRENDAAESHGRVVAGDGRAGTKKKGKRDLGESRDRHLQVQVAKEGIKPPTVGTEADQTSSVGLFEPDARLPPKTDFGVHSTPSVETEGPKSDEAEGVETRLQSSIDVDVNRNPPAPGNLTGKSQIQILKADQMPENSESITAVESATSAQISRSSDDEEAEKGNDR